MEKRKELAIAVAKVIQQANVNGTHDGYLNDDDFFDGLNKLKGLTQEEIDFAMVVGNALMIERMPKEMRDAMDKLNK